MADAINLTPVDYDPFAGASDSDFYNASVKAGQNAQGASVPLTIQRGDSSGAAGPNQAGGPDAAYLPAQPSSEYATMKSYDPTLRERLTALFAGTNTERPSPERARVAEGLANIVGMTPAGIPMAAQEARQEAGTGNYVQAGLSAMAMMPAGGIAGKVAAAASPYVRAINDIGLYSHAAETAAGLPQAIGTPSQFKAMLLKGGVKPAEIEAAGFDAATSGLGKVSRDDVVKLFEGAVPKLEETNLGTSTKQVLDKRNEAYRAFDAGEITREQRNAIIENTGVKNTKFDSYTLPGGSNYREVLLKAPIQKRIFYEVRDSKGKLYNDYDSINEAQQSAASINGHVSEGRPDYTSDDIFKSSHWENDPNVVAHLRMSDRAGPNGEKVLHLEELQSDWGQKGRKEGFVDKNVMDNYNEHWSQLKAVEAESGRLMKLAGEKLGVKNPEYKDAIKLVPELEAVSNRQFALYNSLPEKPQGLTSGPYVTKTQDWTDLGLKRALKEAADGGYDRLTWTPGAEQAKRYDLSKQIDELHYAPSENKLYGRKKSGGEFEEKATPDKLPDIVGKDVAEKLLKQPLENSKWWATPRQKLSGVDLSIGGEGMKSYYDKIVPTRLKEIIKRLDPNVGIEGHNIQTANTKLKAVLERTGINLQNDPQEYNRLMNLPQYKNEIPSLSIKITPTMREKIKKGLPAFAVGGLGTGAALNYSLNPVDHDPFKSGQ